jgi:ubiquinone/menaquinone biosynthesis C-methylase UbiE
MDVEREVATHYGDGGLGQRILDALGAAGIAVERLTLDDLAPVDEFHIGGRQATAEFVARLGLRPGLRLLDVGCGIGGPARFIAASQSCHVTGIDLTEAFIEVATDLSRRAGLSDAASFRQASALALPFGPATFDGAYMIHVGMNIADKAGLFRAVRGVLKPGAVFGVFDIMRFAPGGPAFPVPWSTLPETSFLAEVASYRALLEAAGFRLEAERNRRDFALAFFREMQARAEAAKAAGVQPLSMQPIMGPDFPRKMLHVRESVERGEIAPVELIARAG